MGAGFRLRPRRGVQGFSLLTIAGVECLFIAATLLGSGQSSTRGHGHECGIHRFGPGGDDIVRGRSGRERRRRGGRRTTERRRCRARRVDAESGEPAPADPHGDGDGERVSSAVVDHERRLEWREPGGGVPPTERGHPTLVHRAIRERGSTWPSSTRESTHFLISRAACCRGRLERGRQSIPRQLRARHLVAGLIAGNGASSNGLYKGEAPGAGLVSVKVAGASGQTDIATVIEGVGWVIAHHVSENIGVLNLSLGAIPTESTLLNPLDQAVQRAWQSGDCRGRLRG